MRSASQLYLLYRKDRIRGTVCLLIGLSMILCNKFVIVGMGLELFGLLNLFANFLPAVLTFARTMPYLSIVLDAPGVSQAADFIAGKTGPKFTV